MSVAQRFSVVADPQRVLVLDHAPVAAACRFGAPGLWREVETHVGLLHAFEVQAPQAPFDGSLAERIVAWAFATADGRPASAALPGWAPRPRPASWRGRTHPLDEGRLRIDAAGATLPRCPVQGELVWDAATVAVRFPMVAYFRAPLDGARGAWVRRTCNAAHALWCLARFSLRSDHDSDHVAADVDLTGAPGELLADLALAAREALVIGVSRVVPRIELLVDPALQSGVLARAPDAEGAQRGDLRARRRRTNTSGKGPGASHSPARRSLSHPTFPW